MRIALFPVIHANLPALEAFFKDVETRTVDALIAVGSGRIYCVAKWNICRNP